MYAPKNGPEGQPTKRPNYMLLPMPHSTESLYLPLSCIIHIESKKHNTCLVHYKHPQTGMAAQQLYSRSIGRLESSLCTQPQLVRVHQRHIVNRAFVLFCSKKIQSLRLSTDEVIPVGRNFRPFFLEDLSGGVMEQA